MHENKKYRRSLYILSNVALGLCFILFIPFGSMIGKAEAIIKFVVLPIAILIINALITVKKFEDYRPSSRFLSYVSYLPMFAFIASYCIYLVLISNRAEPNAVFSFETYIILITLLTSVAAAVVLMLFNMEKLNIKLSKNQVNVVDVIIYVDFICLVLLAKFVVADKYVNVEMFNGTALNIFIGLILGAILLAILFMRSRSVYENNSEFVHRDKAEIIAEWNKIHDDAYYNGELLVLLALNDYAKERLIFEDYEKVNLPDGAVAVDKSELDNLQEEVKKLRSFQQIYATKHDKLKQEYFALQNQVKLDVAKTELEGLKKQLSILDSSIEEEKARVVADIEQYKEEKAQFEEKKAQLENDRNVLLGELKVASFAELKAKEEEPAVKAEPKPKVEKVLVPSYDEVLTAVKAITGEGIEISENPTGTTHKLTIEGKAFLMLQKTNSDYRVTFSVLEESIMDNLRKYPGVVEVAKTPKTGNFLRLINKSEFDKDALMEFINGSLACYQDAERRVQEEKEAKKQAELEAKEQEKRNKELLKEAEKIVAKAKKEEEKAAREAEKAAAKEAEKQAKEAENNAPSEEEAA